MPVPVTGGVEPFTPDSLKNIAVPPIFQLRVAQHRRWIAFQDALMDFPGLDRPLVSHSADKLRAEIIKGLDSLYTSDSIAMARARLLETWQIIDQDQDPDEAAMEEMVRLTDMITSEWAPLRKMAAENVRFYRDAPRVAIAMLCAGWENIGLTYQRTQGVVPLEVIDELAIKLGKIEEEAMANAVDGVGLPGTAFAQLCTEAMNRFRLTGDEEKNSSSPSQSSPAPQPSKTKRGARTAAAGSKASARSARTKTRSTT